MISCSRLLPRVAAVGLTALLIAVASQLPAQPPGKDDPRPDGKEPPMGPGGPGGFGRGGFGGGPGSQIRKIVDRFDKDGDGRLNKDERKDAREALQKERAEGRGGRGFGGGPGGFGKGGFGPPEGDGKGGPPRPEGEGRGRPQRPGQDGPDGPPPPPDGKGGPPRPEGEGKGRGQDRFEGKGGFGPDGPGGPGGPGGRGGFGKGGFGKGRMEPGKPGPKVAPADVTNVSDKPFYDPATLRTVFLQFDGPDWEAELSDFYHTDVEVPAKLIVDGKEYQEVGVGYRGASSYFTVPPGSKRSFNISVDFVDPKQRIYGYKTLNLLNGHEDPTLLSSVLYSHIARQYIPTPNANFVKLVVNGESWGVYSNLQQFNKEFIAENFSGTEGKGARWKVQGSPGARNSGLSDLGNDLEAYKRFYQIKSSDDEKQWKALRDLCKKLNNTPPEKLEETLRPILDIEGALKFLALDIALINNDGYWTRGSDYAIYRDPKGVFHIVPHDMNEAFTMPMGPGMAFGGRGAGVKLDPLLGLNDASKPLRSKLLAVPALRAKYLEYVRSIAENSLDWNKLGPVVAGYRNLLEKEVEADTRKLSSIAEFRRATSPDAGDGTNRGMSLREFAEARRAYLLEVTAKKAD